MTAPTIDDLPTPPPSRADPTNFAARGDATLGALPTLITQINAVVAWIVDALAQVLAAAASAVNAPGTNGTSTTSVAIALGDRSLTIQTGKAFVKGQWVQVASDANVLNYMIGPIKSYDSVTGAMVVTVQRIGGSGTFADWVVSLGGAVLSDSTPRNLAGGSTVKDASGADQVLGFRGMPKKSINSGSYTVTIADVGFCLELKAGATIILPRNSTLVAPNQFSADASTIVIRDVAGATHSISPASSTTLYDGSTGTAGTKTLKARGQVVVDLSKELTDTWFALGAIT